MAVAVVVRGFGHSDRRRCRYGQQAATAFQLGGAAAVGEEAIVANAVKTVGQDMEQETADEFAGLQRHHLLLVVMAIVLPAEADGAVRELDQTAVGDGDAVGVAAEIGQHLLGSAEWALGVALAPLTSMAVAFCVTQDEAKSTAHHGNVLAMRKPK